MKNPTRIRRIPLKICLAATPCAPLQNPRCLSVQQNKMFVKTKMAFSFRMVIGIQLGAKDRAIDLGSIPSTFFGITLSEEPR